MSKSFSPARMSRARVDSLLIIIVGFLWHSAYQLIPYQTFAPLFPVNESVWEHLKLGFWPVILVGLIRIRMNKDTFEHAIHNIFIRFLAITLTVLGVFYTYSTLLGRSIVLIDILTYVLGVFLGERLTSDAILNRIPWRGRASFIAMLLSAVAFGYFAFYPPNLPIFRDGPSGTLGIPSEPLYHKLQIGGW